jgi:putative tricarboxylic transport membrane protein
MKRPYQITGLVLVVFAAFMVRESMELQLYTYLGPGPGFFPLIVSVLTGLLGLAMLLQATFRTSEPMPPDFYPSGGGLLRIAAIVVSLAVVTFAIEPLGFRLTMLGSLLFLLYTLGRRGLIATILVAVLGSFGTFQLFDQILKVPLPVGMFGI